MFSEHTEQFPFQQQGLLLIPCKILQHKNIMQSRIIREETSGMDHIFLLLSFLDGALSFKL